MEWRRRKRGKGRQIGTKFPVPRKGSAQSTSQLILQTVTPRRVETSGIKLALEHVIVQIPVVREVYSAYVVGKALNENWEFVVRCVDAFREGGLKRLAAVLGKEILEQDLPSVETNIIWSVIGEYIPANAREQSRQVLSKCIEDLTEKEIDYVERFLEQGRENR